MIYYIHIELMAAFSTFQWTLGSIRQVVFWDFFTSSIAQPSLGLDGNGRLNQGWGSVG